MAQLAPQKTGMLAQDEPAPDLAREAARLSEILPHLVIEARHAAAPLQMGIHGRRRPGPGEEFWEFRPFVAGESISRIDWRRSARDDRLYVREREWETAASYWLWFDLSASMQFASKLSPHSKRDRALVLGLAMGDLLVHAGERVGLLGQTPPMASRNIIMRLADALARHSAPQDASMPDPGTIRRRDQVILIGDFIMPMAEFEAKLAAFSHRGVRGIVVLIRDPAEETFPFSGELEFEATETTDRWRIGDAQEIANRYRARISAINSELRAIAIKHGFGFVHHRTDRPAAQTLLGLAALIGGQTSSLPEIRR